MLTETCDECTKIIPSAGYSRKYEVRRDVPRVHVFGELQTRPVEWTFCSLDCLLKWALNEKAVSG